MAERVDLRYFLSIGMVMSGLCAFMFGSSLYMGIHSMWYLLVVQVGQLGVILMLI